MRIRFKNNKNLWGALIVGVCIFGCKKSFLERTPEASFNDASMANEKGVNSLLIASYAALDGWSDNGWSNAAGLPWPTAGSNWIWGSVTTDDATPGSDPVDQVPIERANRYQYQIDDTYFRAKFQAVYWGVGTANTTLKILSHTSDISAANKTQIEAEARFLRAHYHFDGYRMWKNIPFIDEKVVDFRQKNDVDIFPKIEADLLFAVANLPEKGNNASGRASKGAAQALLARAYVHVGKYAEAKPLLNAIITAGKYSLVTNYHDNFDASKQNNSEMVFVFKSSVNDGANESANGNWGDRLQGVHNMPGYAGCCGFHTATYDLLNAFKTDANGLPLPIATFYSADYDPVADNLDPRVDWTMARPGIPYLDWGVFKSSWVRNVGYSGPFSPKKVAFHKGQYKTLSTATGWSDQPNALDIPFIRYADVLLMAAECEIETSGNLELARTYINMVRARAGNFVQGAGGTFAFVAGATANDNRWDYTGSEAGITLSLSNGAGNITRAVKPTDPKANTGIDSATTKYKIGLYPAFASQVTARDALRFERRLELAMEGGRYWDLTRWGVAAQVLNTHTAKEVTKMGCYIGSDVFTSKHNLYPIPSVEIELSRINGEAQLKQNPGY